MLGEEVIVGAGECGALLAELSGDAVRILRSMKLTATPWS